MKTNEMILDFDYRKIDEDFDIFKFSYDKQEDKGFKLYASKILDTPVTNYKAESLVYESGNSFYVMFKKNTVDRQTLESSFADELKGWTYRLEKIKSRSITEERHLFQLFLNGLSNYRSEKYAFNNLTGKLIYYPLRNVRKSSSGIIWSVECYQISIKKENYIQINATTANLMKLNGKMDFSNYSTKIGSYTQYELLNNKTLRRATVLNQYDKNYIFKSVKDKKTKSIFLGFKNRDEFNASRIGILYNILEMLDKRYGQYVKHGFKERDINKKVSAVRTGYEKNVINGIKSLGINIVDFTESEDAPQFINELTERIQKIVPNCLVQVSEARVVGKLNIVLLHNEDHYIKKGTKDKHINYLEGISTQHVTIEDFNWCHRKQLPSNDTALMVILKELIIKQDLIDRRISIIDWKSFDFKGNWLFGLANRDKEFYFIEVKPDGSFDLSVRYESNELSSEHKRHISYFYNYVKYFESDEETGQLYEKEKSFKLSGKALVKSEDENINIINDTEMYSMPEYKEIARILRESDEDANLDVELLKKLLNEYPKRGKYEFFKIADSKLMGIEQLTKNEYKDLLKIIVSECSNIKSGQILSSNINKEYQKITGIWIEPYLKNDEYRDALFSGNMHINYIEPEDEEGVCYYCVGTKNLKDYSINNAVRIRKVIAEAETDSKLVFERLLPLMNVEFVNHERLTVEPFPVKYLREYVKQGNCLDAF